MARKKAKKRKLLKSLRMKRFSAAFLITIFVVGTLSGIGAFYFFDRVLPRLLTSQAQQELQNFLENAHGASLKIVAVASGDQPSGVAATLATKIEAGSGYVYVSIDPLLVGFDFQDANRKAINFAGSHAGRTIDEDNVGLVGFDIYFIVVGPGGAINIESIDGPSAGAATTIALLSVLENKKIKSDYAITGTVEENGTIGEVGGIYYKAQAARDIGAKFFLVPPGQSTVTIYQEVVEQFGRFRWVTYEPVQLDLNQYSQEQGWGIQITEVSTIQEAAALMLE